MYREHEYYLRRAIEVSRKSRKAGNTPFGALLVDADGEIVMEQPNVEITEHICTGHAETTLAARASHKFTKDYLWNCTLYSTAEPCAMCSGAIYWANIGRVVYGMTEKRLLELTGSNEQNPTFSLPCREVFARGQKEIKVEGPFPEIEEEAGIKRGWLRPASFIIFRKGMRLWSPHRTRMRRNQRRLRSRTRSGPRRSSISPYPARRRAYSGPPRRRSPPAA